ASANTITLIGCLKISLKSSIDKVSPIVNIMIQSKIVMYGAIQINKFGKISAITVSKITQTAIIMVINFENLHKYCMLIPPKYNYLKILTNISLTLQN